MVPQGDKLGKLVVYVLARRNKSESATMKIFRYMTCLLGMMISATCISGEIVYQDYLSESELLSPQDREADAWILTSFDWNYFF